MNDWHPYGKDIDRMNHRDAMTLFYKKMVDKGVLTFSIQNSVDPELMFPTDEREEWKRKRKENKEKGIEVKKRTKVVEEHFDDCGDDLSGILVNPKELKMYLGIQPDFEPLILGLAVDWLKGSEWEGPVFSNHVRTAYNITEMMYQLNELQDGLDLVELCGGEGRVSTIAVRRLLHVGENFDLVTHWDLNNPYDQELIVKYFKKYRPLVAIMGPTCKPFGKLANYNYRYHYETWLKSYQQAAPHGRFCGEIALLQDRQHRYFIVENPKDSWLFAEHPWPEVMLRPTTVQVIVDQCIMGLKTKEGLLAKKPTILISNSELLLSPFQNQRCKGNHEHGLLVGGRAAAAQIWPWKFANRMVEGILRLKNHLDHAFLLEAYPTVGSGPSDPDAPKPDRYKWKCNACRNNLSKNDPRHTRIPGECSREHDESIEYSCRGCKLFKPATHVSHN